MRYEGEEWHVGTSTKRLSSDALVPIQDRDTSLNSVLSFSAILNHVAFRAVYG